MSAISAKIREKIAQEGVSAYALEKRAGLKPSAIHNILYGRSKNPSIQVVLAIAKVLNCTVSDLIDEPPVSIEGSHHKAIARDEETKSSWNGQLYIECLSLLVDILKKQKTEIPCQKICGLADEIYMYSEKTGLNRVDANFAEWIIERSLT